MTWACPDGQWTLVRVCQRCEGLALELQLPIFNPLIEFCLCRLAVKLISFVGELFPILMFVEKADRGSQRRLDGELLTAAGIDRVVDTCT